MIDRLAPIRIVGMLRGIRSTFCRIVRYGDAGSRISADTTNNDDGERLPAPLARNDDAAGALLTFEEQRTIDL